MRESCVSPQSDLSPCPKQGSFLNHRNRPLAAWFLGGFGQWGASRGPRRREAGGPGIHCCPPPCKAFPGASAFPRLLSRPPTLCSSCSPGSRNVRACVPPHSKVVMLGLPGWSLCSPPGSLHIAVRVRSPQLLGSECTSLAVRDLVGTSACPPCPCLNLCHFCFMYVPFNTILPGLLKHN